MDCFACHPSNKNPAGLRPRGFQFQSELSIGTDGCKFRRALVRSRNSDRPAVCFLKRRCLHRPRLEKSGASPPRQQSPGRCLASEGEWRSPMTGLKMLVAAGLLSTISISTVSPGSEGGPSDCQARYPDRDVLTGELTPAGRLGLELPGGAAPNRAVIRAYGSMGNPAPSISVQPRPRRHRSEHLPRP